VGWVKRSAIALLADTPWRSLAPLFVLLLVVSLVSGHSGRPSDEAAYLSYARALSHGHYATVDDAMPELYLWRGPGLPLLLAPLVKAGASVVVMRLWCLAFFMGAVVLAFHALTPLASRSVALGGAYATGLFVPFWLVIGHIYTESVAIFFVLGALCLWVRASARDRPAGLLIGTGVLLGCLTLLRPEYGYVLTAGLIAGLMLALLRSRRPAASRIIAVCAAGLVVCLPWLAYTHSKTGKWYYWSNAGGLSLYWMASLDSHDLGDPHTYAAVFSDGDLSSSRSYFEHLVTLSPVDQNVSLERTAKHQIIHHPLRYVRNVAANLSRMVVDFPFTYTFSLLHVLFYMLANGVLLIFLIRSFRYVKRWRRFSAVALAPLIFAALSFVAHVPVASYPRYWFPIVPILIWFGFAVRAGSEAHSELPHGRSRETGRAAGVVT
jgi:4-amino-4-deoxy-L-arabinose transferase-like glycosyltransferase